MSKPKEDDITRYADMLAAMGTEPRLRIMRLLLSAHPNGIVVGEIGAELEISPSTLSHHLEPRGNVFVVFGERSGARRASGVSLC